MVEAAAADEEFVRKAGEDRRRLSDRGVIDTSLALAAVALAQATVLEVDDAETVTMTDYQDATILGIGIIETAATAKERDVYDYFLLLMDVIYRPFFSTDTFRGFSSF